MQMFIGVLGFLTGGDTHSSLNDLYVISNEQQHAHTEFSALLQHMRNRDGGGDGVQAGETLLEQLSCSSNLPFNGNPRP